MATVGDHSDLATDLAAALGHRGPDSSGSMSRGPCTLAMTRLAIMDPAPRSDQPMEHAGIAVVFNGEIYNFRALRGQLEQLGHRFRTEGDAEVLLHAIVEWGAQGACERIEGMFAFAAWDHRTRSLYLARDRFGIKPLYWLAAEEGLVAASEATPIAAAFRLGPRANAIREFLSLGSPFTESAYDRIAEVDPGTVLTWSDGKIRMGPYSSRHEMGAEPKSVLAAGVERQLSSDRPMVIFLSGGFDSALIAAHASRAGTPISALTLATRDNHEEVRLAEETARSYGLEHEVAEISDGELPGLVDDFVGSMDQPTIDGLNTFLVSRSAIERGFPVALSGLGGDEVLGGYGYRRRLVQVRRARRLWRLVPAGMRAPVATVMARQMGQASGRLSAVLDAPSPVEMWGAWRRLFDDDEIHRLTGGVPDPSPKWNPTELESDDDQLRRLDLDVYMRSTLLRDTDVFSMANGVEVRVPLLDSTFIGSVARDPMTKQRLAETIGDSLLEERARAPKLAFTLPWQRWLALLSAPYPEELEPGGRLAAAIDVAEARDVVSRDDPTDPRAGLRRWALIVLSRWLERDPASRRLLPRPV